MTFSITPFRRQDFEDVLAIEIKAFPLPWSRESYEELLPLPTISFWTAKEGHRVVGYMLYQQEGDELELHVLAVDPQHQRKGIGRLLMQHLLTQAELLSAESISLQVRPSNQVALSLYQRFGFKTIGVRKRYYTDNHEDALLMRTDLRAMKKRDSFSPESKGLKRWFLK